MHINSQFRIKCWIPITENSAEVKRIGELFEEEWQGIVVQVMLWVILLSKHGLKISMV